MTIEITDEIISKVNNLKQEQLYIGDNLNPNLGQTVRDIRNWYHNSILYQNVDMVRSTFKPINEKLLVSNTYEQSLMALAILDILCNVIYHNKSTNSLGDELRINWSNMLLTNIQKYNNASPQYAISTLQFIIDYFGDDIYPEHESGYWLPNSKYTEINNPKTSLSTDNYIHELFIWTLNGHPELLNKVNAINTIINPDIDTNFASHISMCLANLENQEEYNTTLPKLEF